jgi:hypothetical protein
MAWKTLDEWQSGSFFWGHIYGRTFISMGAISMGPCLWSAPILCTPAESTQDYGDWTGSSLEAYRKATCHMGSVLIKLYEPDPT